MESVNRDKHTEQIFGRELELYNAPAPRKAEHGKTRDVWEVTEEEMVKLQENRSSWDLKFVEWTSYDNGILRRLRENRKKKGGLRLVPD